MDSSRTITCKMCGKDTEVRFNKKDFDRWKKGQPIQDALHYLPADERELLLSAVCGVCFNKLFPPD